jgi:hypothetical protein
MITLKNKSRNRTPFKKQNSSKVWFHTQSSLARILDTISPIDNHFADGHNQSSLNGNGSHTSASLFKHMRRKDHAAFEDIKFF